MDGYLDSLKSQGVIGTEGCFTLSPLEARRKLGEYQFQDPHWYIVLLVSAAIEGGAGRVEMRDKLGQLSLSFDGHAYTRTELESLYVGAPQAGNPGWRLGLGLAGISGEVTLRSVSSGGKSVEWRLGPGSQHIVENPGGVEAGTIITVAKPKSPWGFLRSLRGYAGHGPEAKLVDTLFEHSLVPITINGQLVNREVQLGEPLVACLGGDPSVNHFGRLELRSEKPPFPYALGLGEGPLMVVVQGAAYRIELDNGLYGVVWNDGLRTDLSSKNVVYDAAMTSMVSALEEIRGEALLKASRRFDDFIEPELLQFAQHLSRSAQLRGLPRDLPPEALMRVLESLKSTHHARGVRAHLMLCAADWYAARGDKVRASSYYNDSYYFLKETMRIEGVDLRTVSWTIRALQGLGADQTAVADWTLLGACTGLSMRLTTAAAQWYKRLEEQAEDCPRDSVLLKASARLGLAACAGDPLPGLRQAEALGLEVSELRLVAEKQPDSYVEALVLYQRRLAGRYREDILHILTTRGLLG